MRGRFRAPLLLGWLNYISRPNGPEADADFAARAAHLPAQRN